MNKINLAVKLLEVGTQRGYRLALKVLSLVEKLDTSLYESIMKENLKGGVPFPPCKGNEVEMPQIEVDKDSFNSHIANAIYYTQKAINAYWAYDEDYFVGSALNQLEQI